MRGTRADQPKLIVMRMPTPSRNLPTAWLDVFKLLAAQLIVCHHLALYGPMSEVAHPLATDLLDWLADPARLAVQAFFVIGGFLAAETLWRSPSAPTPSAWRALPAVAWRRYVRLASPYAVALLAAVAAAWVARTLIDHPTIPAEPAWGQLLAHGLLLQDILGIDALSAGIWYVAIDFQLYLLVACLAALVGRVAVAPVDRGRAGAVLLGAAMLMSLLVWNLQPAFDAFAPYFLGSYGLGVLARWARHGERERRWALAAMVTLTGLALAVEWRTRIALAGVLAWLLAVLPANAAAPGAARGRATLAAAARMSYALLLIHYPVLLLVGAIVGRLWPESAPVHAVGLVAAWGLSVAAGFALHHTVEKRGLFTRRQSALMYRTPDQRFGWSQRGT